MNTLPLALNYGGNTDTQEDTGVRINLEEKPKDVERKISSVPSPLGALESELGRIFPVKAEETKIQMARRVMGSIVSELSDEELDAYLTEFQFLVNAWLDSFEKQIFEGRKLEQLLKEG